MYQQKSASTDSQQWYVGVIEEVNQNQRTGVIKRSDGVTVFFNVADFEFPKPADISQAEQILNQRVHFKIEKANYGWRATHIAVLQSKK